MRHYVGWLRAMPGGRWKAVCEALSWAGCWDRLLPVRPDADRCEKTVLPKGRHPNDGRKR